MNRILLILALMLAPLAQAANLVPNSSFECGYSRGWVFYQTANNTFYGNSEFGTSLITNDGYHGKYSALLPTQARLQSRALWLNPGTYKLSFYGKGSGTIPFGIIRENEVGSLPTQGSAVLAGTWTQYSCDFTTTTNGRVWIKFGYGNALVQIDAIQLETGSSVTAYNPQATTEVGLTIPGKYNMWFSGDSPTFQLNAWNSGSAVGLPVEYNVFNVWNSNILSGRVVMSLAAGTNTTTTVSLPSEKGWLRVATRVTTVDKSDDEICLSSLTYSTNTAYTTTSWWGGTPHASAVLVDRERLAFRGTARSISVNAFTLWDTVQPTGPSDFVWTDAFATNWSRAGLEIIALMCPYQGTWLWWATNGDGTANVNYYSNYCFKVADRMCNTLHLTNTYFEVWDEPEQSGPFAGSAIDVTKETNYARVWAAGIAGLTNAYANVRIVGGGGTYGNGDWLYRAYTNLPTACQNACGYMSTHIYALQDPTLLDYEAGNANQHGPWVRTFGPLGKTLMNTESGVYDQASYHGWNAFWPATYDLYNTPTLESDRSEEMSRQLVNVLRMLPTALRCIGYGFRRYVNYDCRFFNDSSFGGSQPYGADYYQVDKPALVSVSIAASLVAWGFGQMTNIYWYPYIECYSYTNYSGNPVVAIWSAGRTNLTMTCTNSYFQVLNGMGNLVQTNSATVRITRIPQYFQTSTLTLAQLSNTVCTATVAVAADVQAPQISVDIAPSGLWSGDTNATLIKWTAIDDTYSYSPVPADSVNILSSTNTLYRYKLDSGSYSAYSQSNHVWLSNLASGNHTLYLGAKDFVNNASEVIYSFVPSGGQLNVVSNLHILGNLTIGP